MPRNNDYRLGSPCWYALGVDDETTLDAYVTLLGWGLEVDGPAAAGLRVARVEGGVACGVSPARGRPGFTVFLACDDVAVALRRAAAAGLTPLGPALPLPGVGRLGFVRDLDGQVVGLFHGEREAVVAIDEPGAVCAVWRPPASAPVLTWSGVCGGDGDRPWPPVIESGQVDRWTPVFQGRAGTAAGPDDGSALFRMPDGTAIGVRAEP